MNLDATFDAAQAVNVSHQYLSRLFKDECGKGFVNCLNGSRNEQAKVLMSKGIKLRNLADRTGLNK